MSVLRVALYVETLRQLLLSPKMETVYIHRKRISREPADDAYTTMHEDVLKKYYRIRNRLFQEFLEKFMERSRVIKMKTDLIGTDVF